jgi:rare lipoprotein A
MRKILIRVSPLFFAILLLFPSVSSAFPSTIESRDRTLLWRVSGVPVASFPLSMEKKVRAAADTLDTFYERGFMLREMTLGVRGKEWVISIKGKTLISMDTGICRFHHSTGSLLGGRWLSNLQEGLGRLSMTPWTGNMAFKDGLIRTEGKVSWYGGLRWVGRKTANGEIYDDRQLTAAAKSLPFGTLVRVTDPRSGRQVVVRITDRFFEPRGRLLDLSREAAEVLGIKSRGIARVTLEIIGRGKRIGGKG